LDIEFTIKTTKIIIIIIIIQLEVEMDRFHKFLILVLKSFLNHVKILKINQNILKLHMTNICYYAVLYNRALVKYT